MDIDLLKTFEAIRNTRSFTAAARQVGRTQSAVSLQMRRLEDEVGRPLFERGRVPVVLTSHGETFGGYARRMLATYEEALGALDNRSVEGSVSLGMPSDFAPRILPMVLKRFIEVYPLARVAIEIEESKTLVRRLAEGSVDLAFITVGEGPTVTDEVVFEEPVVWAGPANGDTHLLDPLPLAIWGEDDTFTRWMLEALQRAGRAHRFAVTSPNMVGLRTAVEAGLAVTMLTGCSVSPAMRILTAADGLETVPPLQVKLERAHQRRSAVLDRLEQQLRAAFLEARPLEAAPG